MNKDERSFDDIWARVVSPVIDACVKGFDVDFLSQTGLQFRDKVGYKAEIERTYKQKRDWLKCEYLPYELHPSLDMHKLGAILCRCIIGNKFFSFDVRAAEKMQIAKHKDDEISHSDLLAWEINNIYVNYKLAFLVAEGIAYEDLLFWAQSAINEAQEKINNPVFAEEKDENTKQVVLFSSFMKKLMNNMELCRYYSAGMHDDFVSSMIVSLMKTDCLQRDFDYLMLATILFQWQEFTKTQLLCSYE